MLKIKKDDKVLKKNKKKVKSVKEICRDLFVVSLLGVAIFHSISYFTDKKLDAISVETIKKAAGISKTISDETKFKDYIENFQYSENDYQEDLLKLKAFDRYLIDSYKTYLKNNKYQDGRTDQELIDEMKKKSRSYFFYFSHYFYYIDLNSKEISNGKEDYRFFFIELYHEKYNKNYDSSSDIKIWQSEFQIDDSVFNNDYVIESMIRNSMRIYIEKNIMDKNILLFDNSLRFKTNVNIEHYEDVKDYFDNMMKKRNPDPNFYNAKINELMQDQKVLKETLKLLRANKNLLGDYIKLKSKRNFEDNSIINEFSFIYAYQEGKKRIKRNINEKIGEKKFFNEEQYNVFHFNNNIELKLDLLGYYDQKMYDYYKSKKDDKN